MKVLVIGATGNLGARMVAALLTHGHDVAAYVRSTSKLESLLPADAFRQNTVVQGDAKDPAAITKAILDRRSDAVVNTAGPAAVAPSAKSDLLEIFQAVLRAVQDAGRERGTPLRVWFLAGLGILSYPGTETMLSNYVPIYLEDRRNFQLLKATPPTALDCSILCPSTMTPESPTVAFPLDSSRPKLVAGAGSPPLLKKSWLARVPVLGKVLDTAVNASQYDTTLEQNADLVAADLETLESRWIRKAVGVVDRLDDCSSNTMCIRNLGRSFSRGVC